MTPCVYLAGPILGCDVAEANDWREKFRQRLAASMISGISPLRCEPPPDERYAASYSDPKFGTARAIAAKNRFDVQAATMVLAYLPKALNDRRPSYGTIVEIAWAHAAGKPVLVVTDDPAIRDHPLINACAGWLLETLDEAHEVIAEILWDYT